MSAKSRPVFLEIPNIRLPYRGLYLFFTVSAAFGLFVMLPVLLYFFSGTLDREASFEAYRSAISNPFVKLILIGLLWAYLHHFFAGIRFCFWMCIKAWN